MRENEIVAMATKRLYEMWRANIEGDDFYGGCLAVWDTSITYPADGRGEQCTSADAAGFPIAPLLFSADEDFCKASGPGIETGYGYMRVYDYSNPAAPEQIGEYRTQNSLGTGSQGSGDFVIHISSPSRTR